MPAILLGGFSLVTLAAAAVLIYLLFRSHNRNLLFFILQTLFLVLAFGWLFSMLSVPHGHPMYTEECSLRVGLAGVCWTVSMVFMLLGVYRLLKKSKVLYQF